MGLSAAARQFRGPSAAARQARGQSADTRLATSLPLNQMPGSNRRERERETDIERDK